MIDRWEKECQRITGNTAFFPWKFEAITGGILCEGAVCPLVSRGPRKGKPNYRKHDKDTIQKIFIPTGETT